MCCQKGEAPSESDWERQAKVHINIPSDREDVLEKAYKAYRANPCMQTGAALSKAIAEHTVQFGQKDGGK